MQKAFTLSKGDPVYISGPYSTGDVVLNVRKAIEVGDAVAELGFAVFIPHLSMLWHTVRPHEYEFWMKQDLMWVKFCKGMVRIEGKSPGGDREVSEAAKNKIQVFAGLEDFMETFKAHYREPIQFQSVEEIHQRLGADIRPVQALYYSAAEGRTRMINSSLSRSGWGRTTATMILALSRATNDEDTVILAGHQHGASMIMEDLLRFAAKAEIPEQAVRQHITVKTADEGLQGHSIGKAAVSLFQGMMRHTNGIVVEE